MKVSSVDLNLLAVLPAYTISQVWHPRVDADPSHRWLRRLVVEVSGELTDKPVRKGKS